MLIQALLWTGFAFAAPLIPPTSTNGCSAVIEAKTGGKINSDGTLDLTGLDGFKAEKSDRQVTLTHWLGLISYKISLIDGKASKVEFKGASGGDDMRWNLAYGNGNCYVATKEEVRGGKRTFVASSALCREIREMVNAGRGCIQQCNSDLDEKLTSLFKKHGGGIEEVQQLESEMKINFTSKPSTQAALYLRQCLSPEMKASMADPLAWKPKVVETSTSSSGQQ